MILETRNILVKTETVNLIVLLWFSF